MYAENTALLFQNRPVGTQQLTIVNFQLSIVNSAKPFKHQFICTLRKDDGLFVVFAAGLDGLGTVELL